MVVDANINGIRFEIKVLEEWCGPLSWGGLTMPKDDKESGGSACSECSSDEEDGPPLFGVEEVEEELSEEEGEEAEVEKLNLQEGINVIAAKVISNDGVNGDEEGGVASIHGEEENVVNALNVEEEYFQKSDPMNEEEVSALLKAQQMQQGTPPINDMRWSMEEGKDFLAGKNNSENGLGSCAAQPNISKEKAKGPLAEFAEFVAELSSPGNIGAQAEQSRFKKKKKKGKGKKQKAKSHDNSKNCITIGVVNEEARDLFPALSGSRNSSNANKVFVVQRNSPKPGVSYSINCEGEGSVIGDVSVGDSGIQLCNERFLKEHEISIGNKMWSFAKEQLGVVGQNNDEVYADRFRQMEARDQSVKGRKENNMGSL